MLMAFTALRWTCAALTSLAFCAGCSMLSGGETCSDGSSCDGPRIWSKEWYEMQAGEPVAEHQKWKFGKAWPPYPRPVGKNPPGKHIRHAAKYWPWPFECDDRAYVRAVSNLQTTQGWIVAETLYDYHFDPMTQGLTPAGMVHLRWILENVPADRRCAWVQSAGDPALSQHRLDIVRENAVAMVGEENCPPVMLRVGRTFGRPAAELDALRKAYMQTLPQPRIQYTISGGGNSSTGGSGSSGGGPSNSTSR